MKPIEHRISIAGRVGAALESDARAAFREFDAEIFYQAHKQTFSDSKSIIIQLESGFRLGLREAEEAIYRRAPDVITLREILWNLDINAVLRHAPELHRRILNSPQETLDFMIETHVGNAMSLGGSHNRLRLALTAAFTPKDHREKVDNSIRFREGRRIIQNVPDFSRLQTPEERLRAVIRLMTFSPYDAVMEVCGEYEIDISALSDLRRINPQLFRRIHKEAGILYGRNSLYGILTDHEHGGADSAFDVIAGVDPEDPKTDAMQCPGAPYARNFYLGVGKLLSDNYDPVLYVMKTWDYYLDGNVGQFPRPHPGDH